MAERARRVVGFTLIELLVVIAVISVLASMAMPALLDAMRQASSARCKSNLAQIGKACFMYASQYGSFLPCYGTYANPVGEDGNRHRRGDYMPAPAQSIFRYVEDQELYACPADPTPNNCVWWALDHPDLTKSSYMWSEHVMTYPNTVPVMNFRNPHEVGLVADGWECPNGWTWATCIPPWSWPPDLTFGSRIDWEHNGSVNMLYGDQHIERVGHDKVASVRSNPR